MPAGIELDDAVALGIMHVIGEDGGAGAALVGAAEDLVEVVAVEDVVAEDQGGTVVADEVGADDEGLGEAVRAGLDGVLQVDAPLAAVAEQLLEARGVLRGGDDQDVTDAGQQQRGQRVVDHRLVVDRQQLLGDRQGGGMQPGAGAAGEDDAFAGSHDVCVFSFSGRFLLARRDDDPVQVQIDNREAEIVVAPDQITMFDAA